MNPLQIKINDYQRGIITLLELKSLFFQILGDKSPQIPEKIPEGILEALTSYAASFPSTDYGWDKVSLHQMGSCCCRLSGCVHTKNNTSINTLRRGIEKFRFIKD